MNGRQGRAEVVGWMIRRGAHGEFRVNIETRPRTIELEFDLDTLKRFRATIDQRIDQAETAERQRLLEDASDANL